LGTWHGTLAHYDPVPARWAPVPLYGQTGYLDPLHVMLGNDVISAGMAAGGAVTDGSGSFTFHGKRGLYLHKRVAREAFHLPLEADGKPAHIAFLVKTSDRTALAGTRTGACWLLTRPEGATPEEETLVCAEQAMDAFIAAQTNRVTVRTVAASSTADAAYAVTNLCDGRDGTCWAAATNEAQGAWVEIELDRPARLSSLRLVNGWVPDEKRLTLYPINHRVKQLDVATDAGERALLDVEDHNDPQFLRPAFRKPVRRLRFTVTEIHESESINPEDPPWLNLSELTCYESQEEAQ
ncbi:discoidin domain-containing protein, partial [bacterium]|nr:discoidin domain-containing protein [bacterium]